MSGLIIFAVVIVEIGAFVEVPPPLVEEHKDVLESVVLDVDEVVVFRVWCGKNIPITFT